MNARDIAYGYAIGYNDGLGTSPEGGEGYLRAITDSGTTLTIAAGDAAEPESHTLYTYSYETKTFTESIKTTVKSGETETTHTQNFSAIIITALYNSEGTLILFADCDAKGKVIKYSDKNNLQVFLNDFTANISDKNIGIYGADAAAMAWVMAKNIEQYSSLTVQKKAYREGAERGSDNGGNPVDIKELFETEVPDGVVNYDVDLNNTHDFDENADGIYLKYINPQTQKTGYVHIYNDGLTISYSGQILGYGRLRVDVKGDGMYIGGGYGTVFETVSYFPGVLRGPDNGYTPNLINGLKIHTTWIDASLVGYGWNYNNYDVKTPNWSVDEGFKCVVVSNFPPEGFN